MTTIPTTDVDNDDNDFFALDLLKTSDNAANTASSFMLNDQNHRTTQPTPQQQQ